MIATEGVDCLSQKTAQPQRAHQSTTVNSQPPECNGSTAAPDLAKPSFPIFVPSKITATHEKHSRVAPFKSGGNDNTPQR